MQYFVVVGGGIEQLPMYKVLQKKKIKIIAVDINPKCPARKFCNVFIKASTRDPVGVLKKIKLLKKKNYRSFNFRNGYGLYCFKNCKFFSHQFYFSFSRTKHIFKRQNEKKIYKK